MQTTGLLGRFLLAFLVGLSSIGYSQQLDSLSPALDNPVLGLSIQPDGCILASGYFVSADGKGHTNLVRLFPNGTIDHSFQPTFDQSPYSILVQPDRKIVVGGPFTEVNGQPKKHLARLNPDGTLDSSFNAESIGSVNSVIRQRDNKLLVGGGFFTFAGQARTNIARVNEEGTVDESFNAQVSGGSIFTMALSGTDKLIVGGTFDRVNGVVRSNIARLNLDGTLDESFNPNPNNSVTCVAMDRDGRILIGGSFTQVGGQNRLRIARLSADGEVDTNFVASSNLSIDSFNPQADGKIVVSGSATELNGTSITHIARLNADGTLDPDFDAVANNVVYTTFLQQDGKVLLGGVFTNVNSQARSYLARLENTDPAGEVLTVSESEIIWSHSGSAPHLTRAEFAYSLDGDVWTDLGSGTWSGTNWQLSGVTVPAGAAVRARGVVSGSRRNAGFGLIETRTGPPDIMLEPPSATLPATVNHSIAVTAKGSPPLSFQWFKNDLAITNQENAIGEQTSVLTLTNLLAADAGAYKVVVSNSFGSVTSAAANITVLDPFVTAHPRNVARDNVGGNAFFGGSAVGTQPLSFQWHKDGTPISDATNSFVNINNVQGSDVGFYSLVASNSVGSVTSAPAHLAVNLSTLTPWQPNVFNGSVTGVLPLPDGKTIIYGTFTSIGGLTRNRIARFNPDRTLDASFNPSANNAVKTVCLLPDGKLLVGGNFSSIGGRIQNRISRLHRDGTADTNFTANLDSSGSTINQLTLQPDGRILVAGSYATINGQDYPNLSRLYPDGTLDTSFAKQPSFNVFGVALQADGKVIVSTGLLRVKRLTADGAVDESFPELQRSQVVSSLLWRPDGRIVLGGSTVEVLESDGTLLRSGEVKGSISSLGVQADGKTLFAGQFTNLFGAAVSRSGRLNSDGTPDIRFNPALGATVSGVTIAPNGLLLLNGDFTSAGGQSRLRLAEFTNNDASVDQSAITETNIEWTVGGSFPMASRTTFEISTNNQSWSLLGDGAYATNAWSITAMGLPSNASVRARAYVTGGSGNSASYYVERVTGPSVLISASPIVQTNLPNTVARFSIEVEGTAPTTLQWHKDGNPLTNDAKYSGAFSNSLTINNVFGAEAGWYTAVASNSYGISTSAVAQLVVLDPWISTQPTNQSLNRGQNASFTVGVQGTSPRFQWRKDGEAIPNATNATLLVSNVQTTNSSQYDVVVSNQYGSRTSMAAFLEVNLATNDVFGPAPSGPIYALAQQADGKLLIGGFFSLQGRSSIARLQPNGTVDSTTNWHANNTVYSLAIQSDQKIVVGGWFTTLGRQPRSCLGRYNPDGTLDASFTAGATGGVTFPGVYSVAVQADDAILVAGDYRILAGQAQTNIGRIFPDGTADPTFRARANDVVYPIAVQPDGKILVGGAFTQLNGVSRYYLGRLNPDGSLDTNFNARASSTVVSLALQADGKIIVVGGFTKLGGVQRNRIGRLNPDGSLDITFDPNANDVVRSVALQADGKILVGGEFSVIGGHNRSNLARLHADGTVDTTFNMPVNGAVHGVTLQGDGMVLVGGEFTAVADKARLRVARIVNTEPAAQTIIQMGSNIHWKWEGTSPSAWRTSFEASSDGVNWFHLGSGSFSSNTWTLSGIDLTEPSTVRARGYVAGGRYNCSTWFIEQTFPFVPAPRPFILAADEHFGVISNTFGFRGTAPSGDVLVIERSSDLSSWIPVETNVSTNGHFLFRELASPDEPAFFYRLRRLDP